MTFKDEIILVLVKASLAADFFNHDKYADEIKDIIENQRCKWRKRTFYGIEEDRYNTGCGKVVWKNLDIEFEPYCSCCGKRIEIEK